MLYLVRHAKAGSRRDWSGPDRLRPLSPAGLRQAEALAARLAPLRPTSLISSPYLRCVQTLQPTAKATAMQISTDDCLAEGRSYTAVLELMASLADRAMLCSHGDVIPDTIAALERRGCEFTSPPDWRKASVWLLDRNSAGEIVTAEAWPPPDVTS
jgi:8-oxo-dGTP diphosphatase